MLFRAIRSAQQSWARSDPSAVLERGGVAERAQQRAARSLMERGSGFAGPLSTNQIKPEKSPRDFSGLRSL